MELREETIGQVIKSFRLRKGITQEVLSGLAGIGRSHLAEIENGTKIPSVSTIWKLAGALGINTSDIILKVEERESEYEESVKKNSKSGSPDKTNRKKNN